VVVDPAGRRRRADLELVRRGLVTSREEAQQAIAADLVVADGAPVTKPSTLLAPSVALRVLAPAQRFVSRGGEKLDHAIERFGLDVRGASCLDAGASTGGFTDVLLARGALRVIACDVGYGQLHARLRADARVVVLERTNVRDLHGDLLPWRPDVVVADLSFISLRVVLGALVGVAGDDARFVVLVKPQFEVGRDRVPRGGVVRDPALWRAAIEGVVERAEGFGLGVRDVCCSPITGPAGNVEFLLLLTRRSERAPDLGERIASALTEGSALAGARASA
jgi:23S rRNA (cytidine1920-2'-O)/16S rRNA (cytidine1409-2'-O)-methyltransferase